MCIAGYPTHFPNSDRNECEDLYHSLKHSYNYHMDDCDEIMTLGLADVSDMSVFYDFDETDRDEFHGRIIDQFSIITVDSAPADNHESTLGTGTNGFGNDTRAHKTLYSGQVGGACGLIGNSIDTGIIAANISGCNCDHIYDAEDELLSNHDHKSWLEDELLSNSDTNESGEDELILIVTQRRRLRRKLIPIMTLVLLRMYISEWVVRTQYLWILLSMIIHVSHWVLKVNFET